MANLRDLKRRIASITSSKQITRTMEMVSTARVGAALRRAEDAAPYRDAIARMLVNVVSSDLRGANQPLLDRHEHGTGATLFVLIASDRGLAGSFNMALQRQVEHETLDLRAQGVHVDVITCGNKPTDYLRSRGIDPVLSFRGISSEPTHDEALRITSFIIDGYTRGTYDRVVLRYNHARNRVQQDVVSTTLLPIDPEEMSLPTAPRTRESVEPIEDRGFTEFAFDPSPVQVLADLVPAYVQTVVYHALLDSAAAEHGARRRAMQAATDNAEEALTTLNRSYNRIRQGSITTELNEIIGGASALEDN